ncbi:MAG: spermidine/putrescine ABC transporter substrate-binding protein [Magnetococcales bacterium]|nr:spermidine/putrescine ABC transporter substrate-binding protein [Magnetococcales bacterium]
MAWGILGVRGVAWIGLVLLLFVVPAIAGEEKRELVILNWPDYMDPELEKRFEDQTGIQIRTVHFETDEMRDELLSRTHGTGFDLFVVSGERVQGYVNKGWLASMSETQVPNLRHVAARWFDSYPGVKGHAAPLMWGTLGIAYRSDRVSEPPTHWKRLLEPPEAWRGRIIMEKDSADLMGMAMKAQGYAWNHDEASAIERSRELLMAQKPFVRAYGYPSFDAHSALVTGEAWLAMVYNGDALSLRALDERIAFLVPAEGGSLWVDCLVVSATSSRKAEAYAFIDFLHQPDNAAQLSHYLHFATVNEAAESLLRPEHRNNPVIYPPEEVLTRSEFVSKPSPRIDRLYKEILRALLN